MTPELTDDLFLGGRLRLLQPRRGHRFGGDAALLAAAARGRMEEGAAVADLGAGVGAVGLALAHAGAGRALMVEVDAGLSALSAGNAERNELDGVAEALCADVAMVGRGQTAALAGRFGLVAANPPFDDGRRMRASPDAQKAVAHRDPGDVAAVWTKTAARLLKPGGSFVMIHRPQALGELLAALGGAFGDIMLRPVQPRADAPAARLLVAARKGRRGALALLPPLVMHAPDGAFSADADAAQRGDAVIAMDVGGPD